MGGPPPPARIRNGGRQIKRMIGTLGSVVQTEKECIESLLIIIGGSWSSSTAVSN